LLKCGVALSKPLLFCSFGLDMVTSLIFGGGLSVAQTEVRVYGTLDPELRLAIERSARRISNRSRVAISLQEENHWWCFLVEADQNNEAIIQLTQSLASRNFEAQVIRRQR